MGGWGGVGGGGAGASGLHILFYFFSSLANERDSSLIRSNEGINIYIISFFEAQEAQKKNVKARTLGDRLCLLKSF